MTYHVSVITYTINTLIIRFLPKTGIPGRFGAKNRSILKPSKNHTPGALRLAGLTSYLFSAKKPGTPGFIYIVKLSTVFGEF